MTALQKKGLVLVVSGPSGVGKGTVIRHLMPICPGLRESISYTTRPPREGEVDGRDYFFVTPEEFERRKIAGDFLEWAVVHKDQCYGTSRAQVRAALREGQDIVLEIDCQGAEQVRREWKDAVLVFVAPPTWAELVRRLRGRDTESDAEVQKRVSSAFREIGELCRYDYLIVNESSRESATELAAIVVAERQRMSRTDCGEIRDRLLAEGRAGLEETRT
ncbi:MAG: guanylate kinase [Armatimonadetes bacterium]|nr:guanylate kinase [Armatimonadota bacterium]